MQIRPGKSLAALLAALTTLVIAAPMGAQAQDYRRGPDSYDRDGHDHHRGPPDRRPGPPPHRDRRGAPPPPHAYEFRTQDRVWLQRHYQRNLVTVRRDRRPYFHPGMIIAVPYRGFITPLPMNIRGHVPPPPRGYQIGYYQGYNVVYDPLTYTILSVVDLLN